LFDESQPAKKGKKKRDINALRKAPQAPKRFKSSYICFFMAKQNEIKEELGEKATVTAISKRSAEMWKHLPTEERTHWDDVAIKDKQRYMVEKASYTGPWQVPWKRAKKDPSAPKRPMSAFLYFSLGRRSDLKKKHPEIKNTEVSRLLGEMWRSASEEQRKPHVDKEKAEREKYKVAIAEWRKDYEAKQTAQRNAHAEHIATMGQMQPDPHVGVPYGDYGHHQAPASYMYQGPGYGYCKSYCTCFNLFITAETQFLYFSATYPPGPYSFPTNGKQPIVLGPSGIPYQPTAGYGPTSAQQLSSSFIGYQAHDQQPTPLNTSNPYSSHSAPEFGESPNLYSTSGEAQFDFSSEQGGGDPTSD
jgi:hypothetical protein